MWGVVLFAAFAFCQWLALGVLEGTAEFKWVGLAGLAMAAYIVALLILSGQEYKSQQ